MALPCPYAPPRARRRRAMRHGAKKVIDVFLYSRVESSMTAASGAQGAGAGDAGTANGGAGAAGGDGTIYGTDFEDKTGENK